MWMMRRHMSTLQLAWLCFRLYLSCWMPTACSLLLSGSVKAQLHRSEGAVVGVNIRARGAFDRTDEGA